MIPEDNYIQYTNHGMYYRGDWAKEAGVETINNFEDLGTYFQWVKDNQPDCIPWDVGGKNNVGGLLGGYINSNTGNIVINLSLIHIFFPHFPALQWYPRFWQGRTSLRLLPY